MHAAHRDTSAACHILGGVLLAVLHLSVVLMCDAHGSHTNICAADERPVSAAAKRISCKQDPKCIHETQCGCIPKHCTCGNEACIFAGEDKDHAHADADADADAAHAHTDGEEHLHAGGDGPHHHAADGSIIPDETTRAAAAAGTLAAATGTLAAGILAKAESGAGKHHLVEDDSEGPAHTHADGTMHGHPGGDLPHHHDSTGGLVFDLPKQPAKLVMNKGRPLLKPPPQTIPNDGDDAVDADAEHEQPTVMTTAATPAEKGGSARAIAAAPTSGDSPAPAVVATVGESSSKTNSNSTGTSESSASTQIHQVSV